MKAGEPHNGVLNNLLQTEQVLRTNLEARGLEGLGRAHMEIALAHTLEAAAGLKTGRCRTAVEVLQEHEAFARGLQATLQKSIQHFDSTTAERNGESTTPARLSTGATALAEPELRRQFDNLETAQDALRSSINAPGVLEPVRAHMERALGHVCEGHVAVIHGGTAKTVREVADQVLKVDLVFGRLRRRSQEKAVATRIRP